MSRITNNISTIVVGLVLLAAVSLAIRSIVNDHKNGVCTGGCAGCTGVACGSHKKTAHRKRHHSML